MHLLYIKQYHVLCSIYVLNEQPWIKEEQVPTTKRVVPQDILWYVRSLRSKNDSVSSGIMISHD